MHIGLIISVLLHAAILGWAVITIQTQREIRVSEPEPVAVDLVTPAEMTKLRQGIRTAKNMEAEAKEAIKPDVARKEALKPAPITSKPEATRPKEEVKPEPPKEEAKVEPPKEVKPEPPKEVKPEPPKEVAKAEPIKPEPPKDPIAEKLESVLPDPAIEQAKIEEAKREEQRKADEAKKVEEAKRAEELKKLEEERKLAELKKKKEDEAKKRKEAELKKKKEDEAKKLKEAELKKKQFDAENISALLNKVPDKGAPIANKAPDEPTKNKGPVLGAREGRDKVLTASEFSMFTAQISRCWSLQGGGAGAEALVPIVAFDLDRGGNVVQGTAKVINNNPSPFFDIASRAAMNAVLRCAPYKLPAEKYSDWQHNEIEFDPSRMLGGR